MNHHANLGAPAATTQLDTVLPNLRPAAHRRAPPPRHISPEQQIRLEAAAGVEDARSLMEALTKAVAAPNLCRSSTLPDSIRATVNAGFEAHARGLLEGMDVKVPPRLKMFLALTLGTGMLIAEALELTSSSIDESSGKVTLSRDRGNGTRYQLPSAYLQLAQELKTVDTSGPVLRLSRASLERSWAFMCQTAGVPALTLRDLEFEAQFQLRMRQMA